MDIKRLSKFDWVAAGAGLLTIISLWFPWWGVKGSLGALAGGGGNASAWQALDGIDILIFLLSLIIIACALSRLVPNLRLPIPFALVIMGAGALIVLLVLFRIIDKPYPSAASDFIGMKWGIFATLVFGVAAVAAGFLKLSEGPAPDLSRAAAPVYGQPQYPGQQYAAPQQYAPQPPQQYAPPQQTYAAPPVQQAPAQQYAQPVAPQPPVAQPPVAQPPAPAAPQPAAPAAPGATAGFCVACGAAFPNAEAQFCTNCGTPRTG